MSNRPLVPPNIRDLSPYVAGKTVGEVQAEYDPPQVPKPASKGNRIGSSSDVKHEVAKALQQVQDYPDPGARRLRALLADKNGVEAENIIIAAGSESVIANL